MTDSCENITFFCTTYVVGNKINLANFRVCVPPEHFLVVMYSPLHSKPEFYEFSTCDGKPDLQVSLFTSHTVLTLPSASRIFIQISCNIFDNFNTDYEMACFF